MHREDVVDHAVVVVEHLTQRLEVSRERPSAELDALRCSRGTTAEDHKGHVFGINVAGCDWLVCGEHGRVAIGRRIGRSPTQ